MSFDGRMMQDDYYSVLARMIAATAQDEAQLRRMVYDLARNKLRRQLYLQYQHLHRPEMEDQLIELEAAITRIESDAAQSEPLFSLPQRNTTNDGGQANNSTGTDLVLHQSTVQATVLSAQLVEVLGPATPAPTPLQRLEPARPLPPIADFDATYRPVWLSSDAPRKSWLNMQLVWAVIAGVVIFAIFDRGADIAGLFGLKARPQAVASVDQPRQVPLPTASNPPDPGFPLPGSYGVYAINGGNLIGLNALGMRVPDSRVAISAAITTPSTASLPGGQIKFVVFNRNLMNNVPDKVDVRIVAEVMHTLTFGDGKVTRSDVEGPWMVRGNSYQMKVAPVEGHPDMILIRPGTDDFSFPSGRYELMLNNTAYDFVVAGRVTDAAHCLELTDMQNSHLYTECRNQ